MTAVKPVSFDNYLRTHNAVKGEGYTHTRIGDKNLGIYGGSYTINTNEWKDFMQMYYEHVIVKGNLEYLTEKQLIENGPVMIDIDLRYDCDVTEKQHTKEHIVDALMIYADKIAQLLDISAGATIDAFVMEKKDVNALENKTKDGMHIIIGIQMHKALQVVLRKKVLPELKTIWDDLPLVNDWEDILDEGVTKGHCNWQIYGSRKPGHQAYMVKYHFELAYIDRDWTIEEYPMDKFSVEKNLYKLSARYSDYPAFPLKENIFTEFEAAKKTLHQKTGAGGTGTAGIDNSKHKLKIKIKNSSKIAYGDIKSETELNNMLDMLFEDICPTNYRLKETHDYTMSLPASYYGPGSYNKWIRVGMALHNTNADLFLTWLKFSCQDNCRDTLKGANGKFDWRNVPDLYETWEKFSHNNPDCLTYRSIMYWSKNDAREKYETIRSETVDFFVTETLKSITEHDLAQVLYHMYRDRFVCASIKNKLWYEYNNHRWHQIDSGVSLRLAISKEMHKIYVDKLNEVTKKAEAMDPADPQRVKLMNSTQKITDISLMLKKTQPKQNIMSEACLLFHDKDFLGKLDQKTHLLCFKNGVVDFKQKIFRKGQPDDFISKCTHIDYIPYSLIDTKYARTKREIHNFMKQVFPIADLEEYMWDHLASTCIGVNVNQTFNVYKGVGSNGKSILTDLMSTSLGEYARSVSVALITTKRSSIGSSSSEIAQLVGVRYVVMGEPNKGDKLVEGTMKELSGGTDKIQARQLFQESITFVPQFKMVLMTNNDLEITSNDDGTWRRMRYADFVSVFNNNPYGDPDKPRSEYPYQFPIDEHLKDKKDEWAPVFMSMLVERAYATQGFVKDCATVLRASKKKREDNDYLAAFAKDKVRRCEGKCIKKTELMETFKTWYLVSNPGSKTIPKMKEIVDYMNIKYGEVTKYGWRNTEIIYDEDDEDATNSLDN
jgi:P4 family phage/plasmid primase-like protien